MGAYNGNPYRAFVFDISRSYIILVWDNTHKLYSAQIAQISQDLLIGAKFLWTYSELSHMLRGEFFVLQQIVTCITGVKRIRSSPVNIPPISDLIKKLLGYKYLPTGKNPPNCAIAGESPSLDNAIVYSVSSQLVVAAVVPQIVVGVVVPIVIVAAAAPIVFDLLQQRLAERLTDLTEEQRALVTAALLPPHDKALLVKQFGIPVTRRIIKCLNPKLWLNDEIINYYMQLLQQWDKKLCEANQMRKPSHFFNLFFISKLLQSNKYTYANVKR